jgi:hypothetical protein
MPVELLSFKDSGRNCEEKFNRSIWRIIKTPENELIILINADDFDTK